MEKISIYWDPYIFVGLHQGPVDNDAQIRCRW